MIKKISLGALLLSSAISTAYGAETSPLAGFSDGIHHYQNKNGADYPRLAESDIKGISENVLLYQKRVGGWIENQDPLRILSDAEKQKIIAQKNDLRISVMTPTY